MSLKFGKNTNIANYNLTFTLGLYKVFEEHFLYLLYLSMFKKNIVLIPAVNN